jgi:arylformamidase
MRIYDISLTIAPDLPIWPGDPALILDRFSKMEDGAPCNVTSISACLHIGTHVDAPYHFIDRQTETVDHLSLNALTGRTYVLHLPDDLLLITAAVLEKAEIPPRTRRLLFKTRNSAVWARGEHKFQKDFTALSADAAQYLVDHGVRLVGVDYLSVAPYDDPIPTHRILLQAGIIVVEGLNLSQISQGRYTLYCLPLKIAGAEGAPARAILIGV